VLLRSALQNGPGDILFFLVIAASVYLIGKGEFSIESNMYHYSQGHYMPKNAIGLFSFQIYFKPASAINGKIFGILPWRRDHQTSWIHIFEDQRLRVFGHVGQEGP